MTLRFPDVSSYTPNVDPAQYPILIARATLSDRVVDQSYRTFAARAKAAGTLFLAYHWLNHGNLGAQAAHCYSIVGPGTPVMIDAEDKAGNTGYAGPLTIDDLLGFAAAYRRLGGTVSLAYLPFWYWSGQMGAPRRLGELAAAGLGLVSSNYPNAGYTENGPGWAPYYPGAPAPVQWQYTSTPIDMNAFRGTVADFAALIGGDMALRADPDGIYLFPRVQSMYHLNAPQDGPEEGVEGEFVVAVREIRANAAAMMAKLDTLATIDPAAVAAALTAEQLAEIGTAMGAELARRLAG